MADVAEARASRALEGVRQKGERVRAIREAEWSLAEVVTALQTMQGIDLIAAVRVLDRNR